MYRNFYTLPALPAFLFIAFFLSSKKTCLYVILSFLSLSFFLARLRSSSESAHDDGAND